MSKPSDAPKNSGRLLATITPYALVAPFVLVFVVFVAYPLMLSLVLSTRQTFGPDTSAFVGFDNFAFLLSDPLFWTAVRNTLVFTAGSVFIQLPLALGLALLLNTRMLKGRALFRLVFFSPQLVGLVFVGILASVVFEKRVGLLNVGLDVMLAPFGGFDLDFPWMERFVMPAVILAALWMYIGFNMVYFLAALQSVDRSLTEASMIDGAGPVQRFFAVTLPAIAPVAGFVTLLSVVGSLQLFELPYLMLGGAGPENRGLTIVMYLFQWGFEQGDLGYASAVGWVLAIMLVACAAVYRQLLVRGERA
ncbi:MAG: sugar ABC transporter permease [Planctomycetota bacterium]